MFRLIRLTLLVLLLIGIAFYSKLQRLESTSWAEPLQVSIYPINGGKSAVVEEYIRGLAKNDFAEIDVFLQDEQKRYDELAQSPIAISLQNSLTDLPPEPPRKQHMLNVIFWSLQMRWWSFQHAAPSEKVQVNIYVIYHLAKEGVKLAHSLGLQKGLIGVVNGFASAEYVQQNNIVIAHELLHTVGASDKYDVSTGQPVFPDGYAKPSQKFQQTKAEIMAGKIPVDINESEMPFSLRSCVVGKLTAREIGWIKY